MFYLVFNATCDAAFRHGPTFFDIRRYRVSGMDCPAARASLPPTHCSQTNAVAQTGLQGPGEPKALGDLPVKESECNPVPSRAYADLQTRDRSPDRGCAVREDQAATFRQVVLELGEGSCSCRLNSGSR